MKTTARLVALAIVEYVVFLRDFSSQGIFDEKNTSLSGEFFLTISKFILAVLP